MTRKTTIYDIAVAAQASPTTVSLVLNDSWQRYRIKPETAERVLASAVALGYKVNLKARGLRLSRSGLAGMIVPHYRNRFFAGLAEAFEGKSRGRGLCPVIVSTHRHPDNELKATETLLAHQVEFLFIAGVRDPVPLNDLCRAVGVRCVNIDLPGPGAPSVVSDNRGGARALTEVVLQKSIGRGTDLSDLYFFGGVAGDDATRNRVVGFNEALLQHGITPTTRMFDCCGYQPTSAARSLAKRYAELGRLPSQLFINGVTALEGALRFTATLPDRELADIVVGCFDWDPFAAYMPFDVTMVRQNVEVMIGEGFRLIDEYKVGHTPLIVVPTTFGRAGELDGTQEDWNQAADFQDRIDLAGLRG